MADDNVTPIPWNRPANFQTGRNGPIKNIHNASIFLREHPRLRGRIVFDEFAFNVRVVKPLPWSDEINRDWTDLDDLQCAEFAQQQPNDFNIEPKLISQAVQIVADEHRVHPVRTYLNGLQWDGTQRLGKWLSYYLGAEQSDYTAAVGTAWPISAVARIMLPGCKADHILILEGPQGLRKSTALRALAGDEWFTDEISELGSKDAALQLRGIWLMEFPELDKLSHHDLQRVKAFVTRTTDRFRPPYGHRMITSPRECVFAGTTNEDAYLRDPTGGRRYWPVQCGPTIDLGGIRSDRDQLWAEAVHLYRSGTPWWITDADIEAEAREAQRERYDEDPWQGKVLEWIEEKPLQEWFRIDDLLVMAVGLSARDMNAAAQRRVAAILRLNGFERRKVRIDGPHDTSKWCWCRGNTP